MPVFLAGRLTSSGWIGSATSTDDSLSVPRMVRARAEPSNLAFTTARARRVSDVLLRGRDDVVGMDRIGNID